MPCRTRPVFQSQVRVREHSVGPGPASPQTDKRGAVVRGVNPVLRRELDDRPTRTGHLGFRAHARGCEDGRHLGPVWIACPGELTVDYRGGRGYLATGRSDGQPSGLRRDAADR